MAIFPLSMPPVSPSSETLLIQFKQSTQISPFTGRMTVIPNYASWSLSFAYPRMSVTRAEIVAAWLDQLQGSYGTFLYSPHTSVYPVAASLALASPGYVTSNEAVVGGWNPNAATGLRVGQFVTIATQLLRIAATPLAADNLGEATIEFYPPLRSDMAAGTHVETSNPTGVFSMVAGDGSSGGSGYQIDPDFVPEFAVFNAQEDLS